MYLSIFYQIMHQSQTATPEKLSSHLFQGLLPGFLRDAQFTAGGRTLWVRGEVSPLQIAPLQFLRVTPPPWCARRSQRRVSPLLPPRWRRPRRWRQPKADGGLIELLILHQQRVAAGGRAEPSPRGGAGGRAGAEGAWASVPVGEGIQQGEVEALSVPNTTVAHVPVAGNCGCRFVFRWDGGDLNAGTLDHSRLGDLEDRRAL